MRKRIFQGISAIFVGQLINFATRILLVPLFLRAWGTDIYGEWLALTSIATYISITDFGGQLYVVNRLTQLHAQNNIHEFRRTLHTGLVLFFAAPILVLILFTFISIWLPLGAIGVVKTSHFEAFWVLMLLAFQLALTLPHGLIVGVYRAIGLLPRGMMFANAAQLLLLILVAGALWLDLGIIEVAAIQILPYAVITTIAFFDLHRRFPHFSIVSMRDADKKLAKAFIGPSLQFFSLQISQLMSLQGIVLIVSILFGSIQVVVFTTLRTIPNTIRQLSGVLSQSSWPEITRLDAEGNKEYLHKLFKVILRSTLALSIFFAILFHYFGEFIYHLWLGHVLSYNSTLMDLFLVYLLQLTFWSACTQVLMATNNHSHLSRYILASTFIALALASLLGYIFGLEGVLIGMIVGDLVLPAWIVPYLLWKYDPRFSPAFFAWHSLPLFVASALVLN